MAPTRKSYTACYKLGVVKYAAENGNRAAGRKFGVNEKLVRNWRKAEVTLTEMKTTKKANRGLKARWPQLEERVHKWVLDQRAAGRALSSVQLRLHAQVVAKAMNINDFAGGPSWCHRFMQRNRLSFRARTTMSQKPPADFRSKVDSFREFIEKHVSEHSVTPDHIISMDEVPLTFDIPMGRSVAEKRQKSVNIVTPGHEKSHFTVVLACCGNGAKLPPMVIFKRKTMPKIQSPSVTVAVNEKGWMDEEMMNLWLTKCYIKRPDGFFRARKALLVMDSMRVHITPQLKHKLKVFNSIPAIIPGDLTKILQPLDISVKRSFKAVLRNLWEQWMMDGEHSFTATGRMRHATFLDVIGWIDKAWASVTTESILSGFRKAGIIGTATDDDSDVWLAALRETDKQDSAEQHLICEDHFLPEDISTNGVGSDAIPIMPPLLDGPLGMISPWGAESSEEEDPWAAGGGCNDDGDYADEGGDEGPVRVEPPPAPEPPAVDPPQKDPGVKKTLRPKISGGSLQQKKEIIHTKTRQDVSLGLLTQRFLEMLLVAPDCTVDLRQVTVDLKTRRRRVYDITNVLEGISLLKKQSANKFKWIGSSTISSFLWKSQQKFQRELDNLKLVEDTLDTFIKSCAQQLFEMTDNMENAPSAYVTHEDIRRLGAFQEQTVLVVKAPEETKLEVPAPKEDSIQVHLKGEKGPIMVLTCDIGTGDTTTDKSNHFLTLEESRIKTATLHTESSSQQSAVQSA